jgi:glutaredoxin
MQTKDCLAALEHLLTYLENPNLHRAEADAAISHMRKCPHCENRVGHLIRALTTDEEDSLTCKECEDLLPDYLQAEREGQAHAPRWRAVALHLETCPHCSAEYATLSDLVALAYGERGVEPTRYPVPELSFLRPDRPPQPIHMPWRLDELGRLVIEFSAELLRVLQSSAYQPAYATVGLKSKKSSRTLCQLSLKEAVKDMEVTITAEETRDDPSCCTVIVEVNIPSRGGWPKLADTEVVLKRDEQELETQLTDAFGEAVFEGIATDDLAHLVFEITPCT